MAKGNFNTDELTNFYAKIYAEVENETLNDPYGNYILGRVKGGQKTIFNKTQSEIRNFDMSFLDNIESVYPALLKIMRDPKKTIRYDTEVVPVEKARKTNSETVRHLASHTQFIKKVTNDNVIPSKVLTTFSEDEIAIYENRFIKTLVKRLEQFIERRYEVMKVSLESFETEKLNVNNVFLVSGQEVTINLDIAIKNDLTADVETTKEQYNRLLQVRQDVQGLKGTEFMRALAKAKDVLPPIMKTNIILHNPDFRLAYGLWLYLDRVDSIATNVDVKEKNYKYTKIFDKDINSCMALALTSFIKNRAIDGIYVSKKPQTIKAPKPEENTNLELELNFEADNNKLEDYTMNEVLLSQTSKFYEASLDGLQRSGNKFNESVRVVYRQMLDMLDQIYPTAFGVADDELESKSLYEQLEYARRRMMIFKIVRQAKQMNIARMGKEEKRIEKLISKLEEKIKVQEQRDREREERERKREEARRLAQLERERKERERKRKLERDALDKQKQIEKERFEAESKAQELSPEKKAEYAKVEPFAVAKRDYLKKLREDRKKAEEEALQQAIKDSQAPVRRKDEYDDMTDEELEALMASNDLLDEFRDLGDKPEVKQPKKKVVKKKKPVEEEKPVEAKPKIDEKKDIEDMSADELEALMAANGIFDAADVSKAPKAAEAKPTVKKAAPKPRKLDANSDLAGLDDDNVSSDTKPSISLKPKAKKKEEPKVEEPEINIEDPVIEEPIIDEAPLEAEPVVEAPEEALEELEASPQEDVIEEPEVSEPAIEEPIIEEPIIEEAPLEAKEEPKVEEKPKKKPITLKKPEPKDEDLGDLDLSSGDSGHTDDFENLSDEELEKLFKDNLID